MKITTVRSKGKSVQAYQCCCRGCPSNAKDQEGPLAKTPEGARDLARQAGWVILSEEREMCYECATHLSRAVGSEKTPLLRNAIVVRGEPDEIAKSLSYAMTMNDLDTLVDCLDEIRSRQRPKVWKDQNVFIDPPKGE